MGRERDRFPSDLHWMVLMSPFFTSIQVAPSAHR